MGTGQTDPGPVPGRRLHRPLLVVGLVAVLVTVLVVVVATGGDDTDDRRTGSRQGIVAIKARDGISIAAQVSRPTGTGRHPLVVMPSSYEQSYTEYAAVGRTLTAAGFVTVAYTQRGFFTSGGKVDLAGTKTQSDARSVIDWALRNTSADPDRVGMLGVSYGAGISLLAAARDKRVRAVVALSTWTDLAEAFRPNGTVNVLGLGSLLSTARAGGELTTLAGQLRGDPIGNGGRFDAFARPRSPVTYIDELNRNKPAVMLANGWQDTLFSPGMLVSFYNRLRTPKRLQLSTGDHGGPELPLLGGRASRTGDAALAWLQHYLGERSNGIDRQPPVQLEDVTTGTVHAYPRWPSVSQVRATLAAPSTTQVAITQQPSVWTASLTIGQDSGATIGGTQFVPPDKYVVPSAAVRDLPADRAFVWAAGPVARATRVTGSAAMSVSVSSDAPNATVFAYLYDFGADGNGKLMAMTPYTVTRANQAASKPVSITFEPIDWTLSSGHQLTVVIDTVEPWWYQAAPAGSTLTLSSTASDPAGLTIPVD